MSCPLFIDFTRECTKEITFLPGDTIEFCTTEKHVNCPFYRLIVKKENVCKNIMKCLIFVKFQVGDFKKFVEISNKYCTSENYINCKRFIMKESGNPVPITLHPDGRYIKEWEDKKS